MSSSSWSCVAHQAVSSGRLADVLTNEIVGSLEIEPTTETTRVRSGAVHCSSLALGQELSSRWWSQINSKIKHPSDPPTRSNHEDHVTRITPET